MRKTASILLIFALTLFGKPIYAEAPETAPAGLLNVTDLALPEGIGKIDSRFVSSSEQNTRWVLLIQDIHGHFTAQENISAITDHLNQLYGIETFAIEGGWSKTKLARSQNLQNSRFKQQLARALLEEEYITGPFYSAIFSQQPLKLIGIENKSLYLKNREVFLYQIDSREKNLKKIEAAETALAELKNKTYHPELLTFDLLLGTFREGRKAESFTPSLVTSAEALGADLNDLDQILLFKEILSSEKNLDREKLESEAKRLLANVPNKQMSFEEILRSGQIPAEQLSRYPETLKFQELLKLQDTLSHHAFFAQIETVITRVKEKLFQNEEERALDARAERFSLMKKLILLRAVPEDFRKASLEKDLLLEEAAAADLSEALKNGAEFYKLAQKRDGVFFNQIVRQPLLSGNIAVVAGGFHTEGLTARFEKENISYMIITPSLGKEPEAPNEELYYKRMRENAEAAETVPAQTLSHLANKPFTKFFDLGFVAGVKKMRDTNDQRQAIQTALNFKGLTSSAEGGSGTSSISIEHFMSLTGEEQKSVVEDWFKTFETPGTQRIVLGYRTPVLGEIFKTSEGYTFFKKYIAPDKKITLGELRSEEDEYLNELLGLKQPIRIPLAAGDDLADILIKKFQRGTEKPLMALIDPAYKSSVLPVLPQHPASLMLARLFLENRLSGNVTEEFLDRLIEIMREVFNARGVLESAA